MSASPLSFPQGARVALIGMGVCNLGVLSLLGSRPDLRLSLRDKRSVRLPEHLPFHTPPRIFFGDRYLDDLNEQILFLSPTVRSDSPQIIAARERGARITTDTAFYFENTGSTIFAVSGSDGKSTTSSLSAQILAMMGERVLLGGNIGKALSSALTEQDEGALTVAELSSFQLMHPHKAPKRALLTNLTPNHLDFHSSLDEYYNVKLALLSSAEEPILNLDDGEICSRFDRNPFVGYTTQADAPRPFSGSHLYTIQGDTVHLDGAPYLSLAPICERGGIFRKNLLGALALTHGRHEATHLSAHLSELCTLPHRRELVRSVGGVRFYDSSVDSSPSRTRETLGDFPSGLVVILGGRSKGVPFGILADALNEKARAVIVTGENAKQIASELTKLRVPLHECDSLENAVRLSLSLANEGDAVLFSPASTSFDRFENFRERGERFAVLVNSL